MAKSRGYDVYALTFDYGQRHKKEIESAKEIATLVGAKEHKILKIDLKLFFEYIKHMLHIFQVDGEESFFLYVFGDFIRNMKNMKL